VLTSREHEQCGRFVRAGDRARCSAARGSLRIVLSKYVSAQPQSLPIAAEASGKPYLASSDIHFNVSHSDDLAVIAVSRGLRIGVDIEHIREIRDMDAMLDAFFSRDEQAFLLSRTGEERTRLFFLLWTRREAAAKAVGLGIYEAFARIALPLRGREMTGFTVELPPQRTEDGGGASWWMRDFDPAPGFAGALCVEQANPEPLLYDLQV
jgi:4'-phosphopantetheinyl transferase